MIPGDQGGGGWGYQVVNIGGGGAPALPWNPQSWNLLEKKTRKNRAPGSKRVGAEVAADVAVEIVVLPGTEDA
jgi:hypothetical protein